MVVAERLRALTGDEGVLGRMTGDKFLLLSEPLANESVLLALGERILSAVREPIRIGTHELALSASIGTVLLPESGSEEMLIVKAGMALHLAQRGGRNMLSLYRRHYGEPDSELVGLLCDFRLALKSPDQLFLVYQPKIDARSGRVAGAEALIRWRHPQLGLVPPSRFMPAAERFGLIDEIGTWTMDVACRQVREWRDQGLRVPVSVNLSPAQLRWPGLLDAIQSSFDRHQLQARDIRLELTETAIMDDGVQTHAALQALAGAGVPLSIDDFGTGYSSLSRLRRLPVSELKLDGSFVADLESDPAAAAVIRAVAELAHSLRLKLVAEGVETATQAAMLRSLGCDELQGFFFSCGLVADEFAALLRTREGHAAAGAFASGRHVVIDKTGGGVQA